MFHPINTMGVADCICRCCQDRIATIQAVSLRDEHFDGKMNLCPACAKLYGFEAPKLAEVRELTPEEKVRRDQRVSVIEEWLRGKSPLKNVGELNDWLKRNPR